MPSLALALLIAAAGAPQSDSIRLALYPLTAPAGASGATEKLRASFEVQLARVPGVRLVSSGAVADVMEHRALRECEPQESCLKLLATETSALYSVGARLEYSEARGKFELAARVVRDDGAGMREVRIEQRAKKADAVIVGRKLLARAIEALDLSSLPSSKPDDEAPMTAAESLATPAIPRSLAEETSAAPAAAAAAVRSAAAQNEPPLPVPPLPVDAAPAAVGVDSAVADDPAAGRKVAGGVVLGLGVGAVAAGAVVAVLTSNAQKSLTPDATGAVPAEQAAAAATVSRGLPSSIALLSTGAVAAVTGIALMSWPSSPVRVSLAAGPDGAAVALSGAWP